MSDRITELEQQIEKKKQLLKAEKQKLKEKERRARTHRLVQIGAIVEAAIERPVSDDELEKLQIWLISQKDWIKKALTE